MAAFFDDLRDWLLAARERRIADPSFQRWSLRNPLTGWIARRRARQALDLTAGFVYSQVLFACAELKLFNLLRAKPQTPEELAPQLWLSEEATRRLLDAAPSLELVERRSGERYGLGQIGAAFSGNESALSLVEHQPMLYADLVDPVALLRGEKRAQIADYWPYSDLETPKALRDWQVARYSALMDASLRMIASEVCDVYDVSQHKCLMDVGGGAGYFLFLAGLRAPNLRLKLVDLPAVTELARDQFEYEGVMSRVQLYGYDFLRDDLPKGADLVTLIRIVHDQDDERALMLLRNIRAALEPGATLLIIEAMSGVRGAEPLDAYYGFYTLAMGRGEPRRVDEIEALLRQTGFGGFKLLDNPLPTLTSILVAKAV